MSLTMRCGSTTPVAQIGNLLCRGLAIRRRSESKELPVANLRYDEIGLERSCRP